MQAADYTRRTLDAGGVYPLSPCNETSIMTPTTDMDAMPLLLFLYRFRLLLFAFLIVAIICTGSVLCPFCMPVNVRVSGDRIDIINYLRLQRKKTHHKHE
jgi:hypothetical protein